MVLGAFREAAYDEPELVGVARRLETSVRRHVPSGEFTTALLVGFGSPDRVELLHLGHVAPLRISADGTLLVLEPPDPWVPLGLDEMAEGAPEPWSVPFGPDDVLLLCTDGVVEARGLTDGRFYPLLERARNWSRAAATSWRRRWPGSTRTCCGTPAANCGTTRRCC